MAKKGLLERYAFTSRFGEVVSVPRSCTLLHKTRSLLRNRQGGRLRCSFDVFHSAIRFRPVCTVYLPNMKLLRTLLVVISVQKCAWPRCFKFRSRTRQGGSRFCAVVSIVQWESRHGAFSNLPKS